MIVYSGTAASESTDPCLDWFRLHPPRQQIVSLLPAADALANLTHPFNIQLAED